MRLLLLLMGCCFALACQAQTPQQNLRILISYKKAGYYLEQAVETIEAVNTIDKSITAEYKAGRSVVLAPGFEARLGSTFIANIRPVTSSSEASLQLTASPNPFDQSTVIEYYLPADGKVNLWITNVKGQIIRELVQDENQPAGKHQIEWKPESIEAGIYIPVIEANQKRAASRIIKK